MPPITGWVQHTGRPSASALDRRSDGCSVGNGQGRAASLASEEEPLELLRRYAIKNGGIAPAAAEHGLVIASHEHGICVVPAVRRATICAQTWHYGHSQSAFVSQRHRPLPWPPSAYEPNRNSQRR